MIKRLPYRICLDELQIVKQTCMCCAYTLLIHRPKMIVGTEVLLVMQLIGHDPCVIDHFIGAIQFM